MKIVIVIGIILVVLGIISLVFHGINYTTNEKVLDIGPIHATAEEKKTIAIHPIFGGILLASGIILVVTAWRKHG